MAELRIKELLNSQGLTMTNLAEKIGVTQANISLLLSGKSSPRVDTLEKIASALGVELWQLFTPTTARPNFSAHIHIEEPQVRDFCVYSYEDFKAVAATLEQIMNSKTENVKP